MFFSQKVTSSLNSPTKLKLLILKWLVDSSWNHKVWLKGLPVKSFFKAYATKFTDCQSTITYISLFLLNRQQSPLGYFRPDRRRVARRHTCNISSLNFLFLLLKVKDPFVIQRVTMLFKEWQCAENWILVKTVEVRQIDLFNAEILLLTLDRLVSWASPIKAIMTFEHAVEREHSTSSKFELQTVQNAHWQCVHRENPNCS